MQINGLTRLAAGGGLLAALFASGGPAWAGEEFSISAGPSYSDFAAESVFGELQLVGGAVDARVKLPYSMYGQVQFRSEDGEGTALDDVTQNDYFRALVEGGFEFPLIFGFVGNVGLNYVQSDIDVGARLGDQEFTLGVTREGFGGRAGLAREFGGWFRLRGEMEYSPVEEAIGGIFDLETARSGPWALAIQYNAYPYLRQMTMMLRYRFATPDPAPPPKPTVARSDPPPHLPTTVLALSMTPELAEPPPDFVPPPGCREGDFEVPSTRCDPPSKKLDGQPAWMSDEGVDRAQRACDIDAFEVRPTYCDPTFVPAFAGETEWSRTPPLPD